MRQLTGLDASFLNRETANAPMHISGLSIYDQSTAPGGKQRFKEIIDNIHNRILALPKPGDWRQLCILVSRLHSRPLDRGRPLWELYVIEGLDNVEGCPEDSFDEFLAAASVAGEEAA